jgi:hypothetical protein
VIKLKDTVEGDIFSDQTERYCGRRGGHHQSHCISYRLPALMTVLDDLCCLFLQKLLDQQKILDLPIPKESSSSEEVNGEDVMMRKFASTSARRKYLQLFQLAALVQELQSSKLSKTVVYEHS